MKNKLTYLLPIFIFLIVGCDPRYDIDIIVENNSNENIQIIYSKYWPNDTSMISTGTQLVVSNFFGIGADTEKKLENLMEIPFDTLEISNRNGVLFSKDIFDISNWEKINPDYDGAQAVLLLRVEDSDFE